MGYFAIFLLLSIDAYLFSELTPRKTRLKLLQGGRRHRVTTFDTEKMHALASKSME